MHEMIENFNFLIKYDILKSTQDNIKENKHEKNWFNRRNNSCWTKIDARILPKNWFVYLEILFIEWIMDECDHKIWITNGLTIEWYLSFHMENFNWLDEFLTNKLWWILWAKNIEEVNGRCR